MEWIPRSQNEIADYVSRITDADDWMIDPSLFMSVGMLWGPHTVDCFASAHNYQVSRGSGVLMLRLWTRSRLTGRVKYAGLSSRLSDS